MGKEKAEKVREMEKEVRGRERKSRNRYKRSRRGKSEGQPQIFEPGRTELWFLSRSLDEKYIFRE